MRGNKPWAVKLQLGWTVSGPLPVSEIRLSGATCHVANEDGIGLAEVVKKWWDMESYRISMAYDNGSREEKLATEILNSTVKYNGDRYKVGLLWNGNQPTLSNNFTSALGQLRGLKRQLDNDPPLKTKYSETIAPDLRKGYVSILSSDERASTRDDLGWVVCSTPPSIKSSQTR